MSFTGNKLLTASQGNLPPLTWVSTTVPQTAQFGKVGYGNGRFVSVTDSQATSSASIYSDDGITWVSGGALPATVPYGQIAFGNGRFVATGASTTTNVVATSNNGGVTWSNASGIDRPTIRFVASRGVAYGNGVFVIGGDATTGAGILWEPFAYSSDGVNFISSTTAIYDNYSYRSIAFGNGRFVALEYGGSIMYSNNATTWTYNNALVSTPVKWLSITYGNGRFVATSEASNLIGYSFDGINWSTSTLPVSGTWGDVTFANGRFVAVETVFSSSQTFNYIYSSNGINWTTGTINPLSSTFKGITFGEGKFVAVGQSSTGPLASYTI